MKNLAASLATLLVCLTSWADAYVGFPKSRTLKSLLDAYGPQVDLFAEYSAQTLSFRTYPMADLDEAFKIAQTGLIAASPATVVSLSEMGLVPVGYHQGQIPVGFNVLRPPTGDCLQVGILPKHSLMGALTEYLLAGYQDHPVCTRLYKDISNLGRAA